MTSSVTPLHPHPADAFMEPDAVIDRRVLDPSVYAQVIHFEGAYAVSTGVTENGQGRIGPMPYEDAWRTAFIHNSFMRRAIKRASGRRASDPLVGA